MYNIESYRKSITENVQVIKDERVLKLIDMLIVKLLKKQGG